jgi:uncharacterized protein YndB with AHSA1/START domain
VIEFDIAAPRPTVWEPFTLPGLRPKWRGADEVREASESGRRGEIAQGNAQRASIFSRFLD